MDDDDGFFGHNHYMDESEMSENEMEESEMSEKEMEESEISEKKDLLSELPSSLILQILSLLPMKDVVSTTILSKRWKDLWNTVPCLNFCDYIDGEEDADRIRNFVNRALMFWKGDKIQTFTLDFGGHFDMSLADEIDVWVLYAKKCKVKELNIHLVYDLDSLDWGSENDMYRSPACLNTCSSLEKLSLVGCSLRIPESPLPWDQLNSLRIDGFRLSEHLIDRILSGAPQLEVLKLRLLESNENLNIWSKRLKKLRVEKYIYSDYDESPSKDKKLRIWCPCLESLELCGLLYSEYLLTTVSSLTDVTLGFPCPYQYDYGGALAGKELLEEALRQILSTVRHVEKFTLSNWCVEAIVPLRKKYSFSSLSNVKILKLEVSSIELDKMVGILAVFPKVKTLIIEKEGCPSVTYYYESQHAIMPHKLDAEYTVSTLPKSLMLHNLETVEITCCLCDISVFTCFELLLRHASVLQKMLIRAREIMSFSLESFFLASEKLLSMPRASPTAKVILCKK